MAALLSDIRTAIANRIASTGVLTYRYARDDVVVPEAHVGPIDTLEYDSTYGRGVDRYLIPVRVYVARFEEETAWDELDDYIGTTGPLSLKLAIDDTSHADWSGFSNLVSVRVMEARNAGMYRLGGTELLGVEIFVEVYA